MRRLVLLFISKSARHGAATRPATADRAPRDDPQGRASEVFTDEYISYRGLEKDYVHKVINHAEKYVEGNVHTNAIENFWSLLKRTIKGTYVSVQPFHLFRYLDEQAFRFNNRKENDAGRFVETLRNIVGRRVTYKELTGATAAA